ncbi:MAG: hypothetical protein WD119_01130, partial [Pirellulaceae bacterium]
MTINCGHINDIPANEHERVFLAKDQFMVDQPSARPPAGGSISRLISVAALIMVIAAIGILFYRVMIGFFVPLFLAALFVVIFRPLHAWFETRLGNRRRLAAGLTTTTILLIVLIPAGLIIAIAAAQSTRLLSGVNSQTMTLALVRARQATGLTIKSPETFERLQATIDLLSDPDNEEKTDARIDAVEQLLDHLAAIYADSGPQAMERFAAIDSLLDELRADLEKLHSEAETATESYSTIDFDTDQPSTDPDAQQAAEMFDEEPDWISGNATRASLQAYQSTLIQIDEATDSLLTFLLGGTIKSQLRWLANPSEE